eukprot:TRINITY_DN104322_c0_g1_i1.p1 TRINITY_DN104322_c0_g1~~TRINITY_DN104322_c0_g1_i1.p1  ORF type:complete len:571 (-),score=9.02 TRINITY_DN104322_c0_g1_i1:66-1565(-)
MTELAPDESQLGFEDSFGVPPEFAAASATDVSASEMEHENENIVVFHNEGDVPFGCFSMYAPFSVFVESREYPTCEHYYQASKFTGTPYEDKIRSMTSPEAAIAVAHERADRMRPDWDEVKDNVLERALYAKFTQHQCLKEVLLHTGNAKIVQKEPQGDDKAEDLVLNRLGRALEKVRRQIVLNTIANVQQVLCKKKIPQLPLCQHRRNCPQVHDPVHRSMHSHLCPRGTSCTNPSPWHLQQFRHIDEASFKSTSRLMAMPRPQTVVSNATLELARPMVQLDEEETDEEDQPVRKNDRLTVCPFIFECRLCEIPGHTLKYSHMCPYSVQCTDNSSRHHRRYMHPPAQPSPCPQGESCQKLNVVTHIMAYSHPCGNGVRCSNLQLVHLDLFTHFVPPCSQGSRCWKKKFKDHTMEFSHPCPKGLGCTRRANPVHCRMWTHGEVDLPPILHKDPLAHNAASPSKKNQISHQMYPKDFIHLHHPHNHSEPSALPAGVPTNWG